MSRYEKLPDDSIHAHAVEEDDDIELSSTKTPIASPVESPFRLRILNKEVVVEVSNVSGSSTILNLKTEIEKATKITPDNQRLIFSGRPLKPDEALLSSFNITNESSIHLFPKPPNAPISSVAATASQSQSVSVTGRPIILDIAMDENMSHSASEVRLWSCILIFLSFMKLFDNFNRVITSGTFGENAFDSVINIAETGCSIAGMYVGQLGLNSVRTFDLDIVQKYVTTLTLLAICSMITRVFWVADFILVVKQLLHKMHDDEAKKADDPNTPDPNDTNSDGTPRQPIPDSKIVLTYGIQAVLIALVCLAAWFNCVVRARRFRNDVQAYRGSTRSLV